MQEYQLQSVPKGLHHIHIVLRYYKVFVIREKLTIRIHINFMELDN